MNTLRPDNLIFSPDPHTAQQAASAQARALLSHPDLLVIDTETTGLEGQVWQFAAVHPESSLPALMWTANPPGLWTVQARQMHAAHLARIQAAPNIRHFKDATLALLEGRPVMSYNAEFDQARLEATFGQDLREPLWCVAQLYAPFAADWSERRGTWRTPSLKDACAAQGIAIPHHHTALDDALGAAALLQAVAQKTP